MKKVLFVATVVKTHINVFHLPYIKMFKENGYKTYVAAKNDFGTELPEIPNCDRYIDIPFERSPFAVGNIKAYKMLKRLIDEEGFNVIVCNTPVGGVLGRLAARAARRRGTKVIYIAHGFHFFKGSSALSWLVFYPIERLLSRITDVLVTINNEDYDIALKKFRAKKTIHINGIGIDTKKITDSIPDRHKLCSECGVKDDVVLLVSVGELRQLKNHKAIIQAMAKLKNPSLHYVIAGSGPLDAELGQIARECGLENNLHLLGFRKDICEILKSSDIFCFPSYREGMPVSLMEAMAAGLPAVASAVRGNTDLIVPGKGGYLYPPDDIDGFANGIKKLIEAPDLRRGMGEFNKKRVKDYDIRVVGNELKKIFFNE